MKKIISVLLIMVVLICAMPASAKYYENKNYGYDFTVSDNWVCGINSGDTIGFEYRTNSNEYFVLDCTEDEEYVYTSMNDSKVLLSLCEKYYSDYNLADSLSETNNANVTVKTTYMDHGYVTYNDITYYRYEKTYTASAYGFYTQTFYKHAFFTVQNGKLYHLEYSRDKDENHFKDVANVLNSLSFVHGEIKIIVDGVKIKPDSTPYIIDGRTIVPIRAVAEKMGYKVEWDGTKQIATLTSGNGSNVLHFGIGSDYALRNYNKIALDVPATIINSRTYLPLRAVAEAMDADVKWDGSTRTVIITSK